MAPTMLAQLALAIGLGLLGFVEPCTMGSNLVLVKYLEARRRGERFVQILIYTATRALFMGGLGLLAGLAGSRFFGVQRAMWILLGAIYLAIGLVYLSGRRRWLMRAMPGICSKKSGRAGSAVLGVIFGLNVPACAGPLIFALLGIAAARGAGEAAKGHGLDGGILAEGFISLLVFGLALSAPLVLAVAWRPMRRGMDWLANLSVRVPKITGCVLIGLGLWCIGFGMLVHMYPPT